MTAIEAAIVELTKLLPNAVTRTSAMLEQHSHGDSWHRPAAPDAVIFAESTAQVSDIIKICAHHRVPVIPFGAGSSIEGQVHAVHGGISLDLSRMNRVIATRPSDMDCTVEAGVTRQQLNEELRTTGLFFPVDLGAHATLGGMAATRASGTTTVRYGSMKDLVLSMTVVLADGRIIKTGGRARKSSAGYDLTRLFIGSEGTLGVITELNLRLFGVPEAAQVAFCSFPTIRSATEMVVAALQLGLSLNRIELADSLQIMAINRYAKTELAELPTLFIDVTGSSDVVKHDLAIVESLAAEYGATRFKTSTTRDEYDAIWSLRHKALYASRGLKPGAKGISTDVCVPISKLPDIIGEIQKVIAETDMLAPLVGHVGDGNFHLVLLFDPEDDNDLARAKHINAELVKLAIAMDGTSTGEHGVGIGKKDYLPLELGEALDVMKSIKAALDPNKIMNPGKIFDL
jgi:D-lactate dehydrogenase (cytochrome)